MENPAPFDLNQAVLQWRRQLAISPALRQEDLDELENHLRDAIASLEIRGLNPQEAFWIARHRLGHGEHLQSEFGKVNTSQVWLDRALWMILGFLGIWTISSIATLLLDVITYTAHWTPFGKVIGPANLIIYPLLLASLVVLATRAVRTASSALARLACWVQAHPVKAVFSLVASLVMLALATSSVTILMLRSIPMNDFGAAMKWRWPASLLSNLIWPVLLGWLLIRSRRQTGTSPQQ